MENNEELHPNILISDLQKLSYKITDKSVLMAIEKKISELNQIIVK